MSNFIFLYPIPEYIDTEIARGARTYHQFTREYEFAERFEQCSTEIERNHIREIYFEELFKEYAPIFSGVLNSIINDRYRTKGFQVTFVLFKDHEMSQWVEKSQEDGVIYVDLDFVAHIKKRPDGSYPYPDPNEILNQIATNGKMVVSGFHMWDCVEKVARKAHEISLDVLVDEDLTEFFPSTITEPTFRTDSYPNYKPRKLGERLFEEFLNVRRDKPWLWQDY